MGLLQTNEVASLQERSTKLMPDSKFNKWNFLRDSEFHGNFQVVSFQLSFLRHWNNLSIPHKLQTILKWWTREKSFLSPSRSNFLILRNYLLVLLFRKKSLKLIEVLQLDCTNMLAPWNQLTLISYLLKLQNERHLVSRCQIITQ